MMSEASPARPRRCIPAKARSAITSRKLKDDPPVSLFRLAASGLQTTEQGSLLAQHVSRGIEAFRTGLGRIAQRPGPVRVALLPMFARRWLSSRRGPLAARSTPALPITWSRQAGQNLRPRSTGFTAGAATKTAQGSLTPCRPGNRLRHGGAGGAGQCIGLGTRPFGGGSPGPGGSSAFGRGASSRRSPWRLTLRRLQWLVAPPYGSGTTDAARGHAPRAMPF